MSDVNITVKQSGPYVIRGPVQLVDADGNEYTLESDVIALCRCGQSSKRPFCDGSHGSSGFTAEERSGG